jgi:hypothetical protein
MTRDEMIGLMSRFSKGASLIDSHAWRAVYAVVELHKPDSTGGCNACEQWTNEGAYQLHYPCPTIQAIEKELE